MKEKEYSNWFENRLKNFLLGNIKSYLKINKPTSEKINLIEKELNLDLSKFKKKRKK